MARLTGPRPILDPRRNIVRSDLIDIALAGDVAAASYVAPAAMQCAVPRAAMRARADIHAVAVSELLFGEMYDVFETTAGWSFGRSPDRYAGWVRSETLAEAGMPPVHRVTAATAPVFETPDIKSAVLAELPFGAHIAGAPGDRFIELASGGFVHNRHIDHPPHSVIAAARVFTGAPYLWGGRTPAGVDCSGLVQAALAACGVAAPRDSDQQRSELGRPVDYADRAAGDLVFFPGHVGILTGFDTLFHANAFWMTTLEEPLADVIQRLHESGIEQPVTAVRRV
ncbi:C40 family peptidase [Sandarakinorhabdus glacialis]|nr:NlpC/P60 family protein [Polymorphobacter glacialis]